MNTITKIAMRMFPALSLALVLVCSVSFLTLVAGAQAPTPTLATDKPDYAPAEVVHITGTGYAAGVTYALPVMRPDGSIVTIDPITHLPTPGWDTRTADAAGNLTYDYLLNGIAGTYEVRAYPHPWSGDWNETPLASVTFTDAPPAGDLDQCANGPSDTPVPCTNPPGPDNAWQNGNLNANQAHYVEGHSVPYRLRMTDLPTDGTVITLTLGYDIKHSDKHAIDFLTHYQRLEPHASFGHAAETVDPTSGVTGLSSTTTTYTIPVPSTAGSPVPGQPATRFNSLPAAERVMTLFGGTISNVFYVSEGSLTASQAETRIAVVFTVDSATAVLAWGGHIARCADWGTTGGVCNSASGISGSPYHMRQKEWNLNNLGNQDRSLAAGAVEPAGTVVINKVAVGGDATFDYLGSGSGISSTFSIATSGGTGSVTFSNIVAGAKTVTETVPSGWDFTNLTCSDPDGGTTISGQTANIDLDGGETVTCTYTNTKRGHIVVDKVTVPSGDPTSFSFTTTGSGYTGFSLTDADPPNDQELAPGTYSVTETVPTGWTLTSATCSDDSAPSSIGLDPAETVTCTFTNTLQLGTITIIKDTVPDDPQDFAYAGSGPGGFNFGGGFSLDDDADGTLPNMQSFSNLLPGSYTVIETLPVAGFDLTNLVCVDPDNGSSTNVGTGTATIDLDSNETVTCTFTNTKPSVTVDKTGDELSKIGDSVTYVFTITNTTPAGSPNLILDSVSDTLLGDLTADATAAGCGSLVPGASCSFTKSRTVQAGDPDPLPNTVTVHYHLSGFATDATDSDSHSVNLFQPGVVVEKTGDAFSKVGDTVTYNVTITNTSSADTPTLILDSFSDTLVASVVPPAACNSLAPGASCTFSYTYTVQSGDPDPLLNTADAHYHPDGFTNDITDSDSHSVDLFTPSVTIDKTGDTLSKVGDTVTYNVTITNTSSADTPTLILDSFSDTLVASVVPPAACNSLAPGASCSFSYIYTVQAGDPDPLLNTAEAHYHPDGFSNDITASDGHSTNLFQPSVTVVKTGPTAAVVGATITYNFTITNTSSSDSPNLILDSVTDVGTGWAGLGDLTATASANGCGSLAPGTSCSFSVNYTIQAGDPNPLHNTVTVHYHPDGFPNDVSDSDDHSVTIVPPSHFTDTSFCPLTGPFRLLYHLNTLSPTTYRLQASNPGQFYYNVFYTGNPGDQVTLYIQVPYPFITQEGAGVPIQVHDAVSDTNGNGCVEPSPMLSGYIIATEAMTPTSSSGNQIITFADYKNGTTIGTSTTTVTVTGEIPSTGLLYVTIHLDYGLKKTINWSRGEFGGTSDTLDARQGTGGTAPIILNGQTYNFSFTDGSNTFTSTPTSVNEFKRFAGFMGFVTSGVTGDPVSDVTVQIYNPTGDLLATVLTDADGFYYYEYKHKAKSATYTIKLPDYSVQQSVTIKANGFAVVNFSVP